MDRLESLESFVAVVEAGQFSSAAERLGIARSVISRRVAQLESRLGVQLLQRTTRRLSLTDAGRSFYQRTAHLLAELAEAELNAAEGQQALQGRLRLAAPLSFGLLHLAPALHDFMAEHPQLSLDLDLNDREVNLVEEGMDLAVRIGLLEDSNLVARPLAPIRMVLCASPGYLKRHGSPTDLGQLSDHQALIYGNVPENQQWRFTDPDGNERVVHLPVRLRANNGDVLLGAAEAGLGICVSPTFIAHRSLEQGKLRVLLPNYGLPQAYAYAVYPSRRFVPRRVRLLLEYLLQRFGDKPYWDAPVVGHNTP